MTADIIIAVLLVSYNIMMMMRWSFTSLQWITVLF